MTARWRIVDLSSWNQVVKTDRGCIVVDGEKTYLDDVAVILVGVRTSYSGALTTIAASREIPILTVDWKCVPVACTFGWSENSRVAARHLAQANLSKPRMKNAWMQLVKGKIRGQASNLSVVSEKASAELREIASSVLSGDPQNLEARAARTYWSQYFSGEEFSRRSESNDGRNALLNYGYAVVRGLVVAAICEAGLWPTLGLWHRNRANVFALADDLIEPFRPVVDFKVKSLARDATLEDPEIKRAMVSCAAIEFGSSGFTTSSEISMLARHTAMYVEGEMEKLKVNHWVIPNG